MVVAEQTAEAFTALNDAFCAADFTTRVDQLVVESLMVSFRQIVSLIFGQRATQRFVSEKDHAVETLFAKRAHEAFEMRIQIRASWWQQHDFGVGAGRQKFAERRELGVAVHEQV